MDTYILHICIMLLKLIQSGFHTSSSHILKHFKYGRDVMTPKTDTLAKERVFTSWDRTSLAGWKENVLVRNRIYRIIHWRRLCHDHSWLSKQVYTFKQATSKDLRLHFIHQFLKQQLIEEKKTSLKKMRVWSVVILAVPNLKDHHRCLLQYWGEREKKRKKLFRTAICSDSVP